MSILKDITESIEADISVIRWLKGVALTKRREALSQIAEYTQNRLQDIDRAILATERRNHEHSNSPS